jgi:hypothetical protein
MEGRRRGPAARRHPKPPLRRSAKAPFYSGGSRQPQHGKGALDLAHAATLGKGAALTSSVVSARAKRDRGAPAAGERCRRFLFREFRTRLEPPLVRSAAPVRGTGTSPTRWPQPQHGKGSQACSLFVDVVQRQRHAAPTTGGWSCRRGRGSVLFRELRSAPAAMELEDGDLELLGRPTGSLRDRGAVAHSGWGG